jgi:hypothetical protein
MYIISVSHKARVVRLAVRDPPLATLSSRVEPTPTASEIHARPRNTPPVDVNTPETAQDCMDFGRAGGACLPIALRMANYLT